MQGIVRYGEVVQSRWGMIRYDAVRQGIEGWLRQEYFGLG